MFLRQRIIQQMMFWQVLSIQIGIDKVSSGPSDPLQEQMLFLEVIWLM